MIIDTSRRAVDITVKGARYNVHSLCLSSNPSPLVLLKIIIKVILSQLFHIWVMWTNDALICNMRPIKWQVHSTVGISFINIQKLISMKYAHLQYVHNLSTKRKKFPNWKLGGTLLTGAPTCLFHHFNIGAPLFMKRRHHYIFPVFTIISLKWEALHLNKLQSLLPCKDALN